MLVLEYRLKQFEPFVNHVGQTEPGRGEGTRPGIVDNLIDDAIETVNFPKNDLEVRSARIIGSRIVQQESGRGPDSHEWIADFVRDACGELAQCGESFCAPQLRLHLIERRN